MDDKRIYNINVLSQDVLLTPEAVKERVPITRRAQATVLDGRQAVESVLDRSDHRLIVVVGPCSIHDPSAAMDYAQRLKRVADEVADTLLVVMRVYFEKPRTTVGWRGLINDPHLDGSFAVNDGLRLARRLLLDVVALGLPTGCEFLDPISPQFFADTVTWAAIGARTTESQVHRNLASGLSMPVGFKNGTGGGIQMAIDALRAAASPHSFLSVTEQGLAAIVTTRSNPDCHVVLRGGRGGPNYDLESVQRTLEGLRAAGLPPRVMIDASHDNSQKDYRRQPLVAHEIAAQVAEGEAGIVGVMLESFLVEGRQDFLDKAALVYGQSITDSCMSWETTVLVLRELAEAARARRSSRRSR
jgi:3-deoxy-7-phosphoheptulonate synthase